MICRSREYGRILSTALVFFSSRPHATNDRESRFFPAWCHPYIIDETTAAKKNACSLRQNLSETQTQRREFSFHTTDSELPPWLLDVLLRKRHPSPSLQRCSMGLVVIPEAPKSSICSRGADRRGGDADGCEVCSYRRAWLLGCFSDRFPRVNSRSRRKSRFGILTRDIFIYGPNKKKKHTEILKIQPKFREPRTAVAQAQPSIVHGLVGILSSRLHETNAGAESRFFFVCLSRARRLLGLPTSQSVTDDSCKK